MEHMEFLHFPGTSLPREIKCKPPRSCAHCVAVGARFAMSGTEMMISAYAMSSTETADGTTGLRAMSGTEVALGTIGLRAVCDVRY
eukprot:2314965-Rhodomonas_salina.2